MPTTHSDVAAARRFDAPTGARGESTHLAWLDLLRFIAAFAVVLVHARGFAFAEFGSLPAEQRTPIVAALFAITRVGNEAVTVFFVLSGFLVGGKAIERMCAGQFRLADYAIDRISRIYVPLIPALALSAVVGVAIGAEWTLGGFIGNLLGLQGVLTTPFAMNGPLWSLAYEVWFYIMIGGIGLAATDRRRVILPFATLVVVACIFTALSPTFLFCWAIGAFAWLCRPSRVSFPVLGASCLLIFYGTLGVEVGMVSDSVRSGTLARIVPGWDVSHLLLSAGTALFIQQIILWRPRQGWLAAIERAGTPLGAFSYTLYLVHYPFIRAIVALGIRPDDERAASIDARSIATFAALLGGSVIGSIIFYVLFERHTAAVRRWMKAMWGGIRR